jgi:hypothetical protein
LPFQEWKLYFEKGIMCCIQEDLRYSFKKKKKILDMF